MVCIYIISLISYFTPCLQSIVFQYRKSFHYGMSHKTSTQFCCGLYCCGLFCCGYIIVLSWCMRLTHWGRDKMTAISQTTFSNAFPWLEMYEFRLKFHWSLLLGFSPTRRQRFSEPMMITLLTHICVTRPQWVLTHNFRGCFTDTGSVELLL